MFKEIRGLEYALEIIRAFHHNSGRRSSKEVYELVLAGGRIDASPTYTQKILPRLAKLGILHASEAGYAMTRSIDEITINQILDICDMPDEATPLYKWCVQIKAAVSLTTVDEFYDFSTNRDR